MTLTALARNTVTIQASLTFNPDILSLNNPRIYLIWSISINLAPSRWSLYRSITWQAARLIARSWLDSAVKTRPRQSLSMNFLQSTMAAVQFKSNRTEHRKTIWAGSQQKQNDVWTARTQITTGICRVWSVISLDSQRLRASAYGQQNGWSDWAHAQTDLHLN